MFKLSNHYAVLRDIDRTGVYLAAYHLVDQHWTADQMNEEFRLHHQKAWWPVFRKYQSKVIAYAEKRQAAPTLQ